MSILRDIPVVLFWSLVLSFVPAALFLILKESQTDKDERARSKAIFVIRKESEVEKERKDRLKVIIIIYGVCLVFFSFIYAFNLIRYQETGINPFDILSALSVVLFCFSILTYLPITIYLAIKEPHRYEEERIHLNGITVIYGVCLFIFSCIYAFQWLKNNQIPLGFQDLLSGLFVILCCSAILSYLPVLAYILFKEANQFKNVHIRVKIVFTIYSICFLVFSSVYIFNWIKDRRAGIERIPWRIYLQL